MAALTVHRRNFVFAVVVVFLIALILFSTPPLDTERFRIISNHGSSSTDKGFEADTTPLNLEAATPVPTPEIVAKPKPSTPVVEKPKDDVLELEGVEDEEDVKIAKLHYLVPASQSNLRLCYNLLSSAINRYPVPVLAGWNGTDEFDAAKTHLAKLRSIKVYLDGLEPANDEDLVLIVDGYDVILQLPPDVMIERYFNEMDKANARLADRFGVSVKEARARGLYNSIFLGPDKVCWPIDHTAPRCWAAPRSHLSPTAWGPKSGNGDLTYNDPRWLNSGTILGPVDDLREYIDAIMQEIDETYDEQYEFKESDQYYMANVWGRQEYWRSKLALDGDEPPHGANKVVPKKSSPDQETDYHVAIEYESALFQTKAGNDPFLGFMQFNEPGMETSMKKDMFKEGEKFRPYRIRMPANVLASLKRLYNSIPEVHQGVSASVWIRKANLGVNYITKHVFPLWHCTGPKDAIDGVYRHMWFYPLAKSLLKSSAKAVEAGEPIAERAIDGRLWVQSKPFPEKALQGDDMGGAWSDHGEGAFLSWQELCGEHADILFKGEEERNKPVIDKPQWTKPGQNPGKPGQFPKPEGVKPATKAPKPEGHMPEAPVAVPGGRMPDTPVGMPPEVAKEAPAEAPGGQPQEAPVDIPGKQEPAPPVGAPVEKLPGEKTPEIKKAEALGQKEELVQMAEERQRR